MTAAARTPSAATPLVSALTSDCEKLMAGYADMDSYGRWGSKASKMSAASHMQQRSNHSSAQVYARKGKQAMRSAMSAMAESDDEEGPSSVAAFAAASAASAPPMTGPGPMRSLGASGRSSSGVLDAAAALFGGSGKKKGKK